MRTGIANILNNTVELDPLDIAVEAALVQAEFRDRLNSITAILNAYDNLVELKRLRKLYPSSADIVDEVVGTSVESISLEAIGTDVWNKIKEFFEWVWNGIKKLFGVSEKKIAVTIEVIRKKRSKSKGDNIGKTISVKIVTNESFNAALVKIQEMISKLEKSIPTDNITSMNKMDDSMHADNAFATVVNAVKADLGKVETLKVSKWSEADTIINRVKEYSNKLKAEATKLGQISQRMKNLSATAKESTNGSGKVKYASMYTRHVKSALEAINGCETIIAKSIEPLAHDTDSGTDQNAVAPASKPKK